MLLDEEVEIFAVEIPLPRETRKIQRTFVVPDSPIDPADLVTRHPEPPREVPVVSSANRRVQASELPPDGGSYEPRRLHEVVPEVAGTFQCLGFRPDTRPK